MDQQVYPRFSRALSISIPLIASLFFVTGCNNTCVSGTLNGPNGSTINVRTSSPPPSCVVNTATGILHLEIGAAPGVSSAPSSTGPHITHLFVALAGVDVHSSPLARDDTPGWQPLTQQRPVQVDLLADPSPSGSASFIPDSVLPAGVYRQIRLRFASLPPASLPPASLALDESVLAANHCGTNSPHCAVMSDGRVLPLIFPPSRPDFRMMLESASGRELYVPPDGTVTLAIELDPVRSYLWPSGESVLFAPVFHLSVLPPDSSSQD